MDSWWDDLLSIFGIVRRPTIDPDERWSNLHREREKNAIYRWVGSDMKKEGELVGLFLQDGEEGMQRFLHEKIPPLLYNDGEKPETLKLKDYLKFRDDQRMNLGVDDYQEEGCIDVAAIFEEHLSQWRLNKRGIEGETLVHLLLSRGEPAPTEIARILIKEWPGLAMDIYEGDEKYGQSALHLAIINNDYDTVCFLLDCGAPVNQRTRGLFFLPEDQNQRKPKAHTNYEGRCIGLKPFFLQDDWYWVFIAGYAYYGEYPLAFAASLGNKDIYDALLRKGADPNLQDKFGNTVLHICVINNSIEMYSYSVRHYERSADVNIINAAGYTPLTLAAMLGRREVFDAMLELMKVEYWRFSNMACSAYPLTALDTINSDGTTNWDSALMRMITSTTGEAHLSMVESEIVERLIQDKWRNFGQGKLYKMLAQLCVYLFTLSVSIYLRPLEPEEVVPWRFKHDEHYQSRMVKFVFRCIMEACTALNGIVFLFLQCIEIKSSGLKGWAKNLRNAPTKVFFLFGCALLFLSFVFRATEDSNAENILLSLAIPCSWIFLLFFARSYRFTGPFVQMVFIMVTGDLIRFLIIALIVLFTFVPIFFFLGKDMWKRRGIGGCPDNTTDRYYSFMQSFMTFARGLNVESDSINVDEFACVSINIAKVDYVTLTKIMYLLYVLTMCVMVVNMLIALMGNTYTDIMPHANKAWKRNFAKIILALERSLNPAQAHDAQQEYTINMAEEERSMDQIRGVMVIKQTRHTRAMQQKLAIANWKRLGRKIVVKVKTLGVDRTRFLVHHASRLTTPILASSLVHDMHIVGKAVEKMKHWASIRSNAAFTRPSTAKNPETPKSTMTIETSIPTSAESHHSHPGTSTTIRRHLQLPNRKNKFSFDSSDGVGVESASFLKQHNSEERLLKHPLRRSNRVEPSASFEFGDGSQNSSSFDYDIEHTLKPQPQQVTVITQVAEIHRQSQQQEVTEMIEMEAITEPRPLPNVPFDDPYGLRTSATVPAEVLPQRLPTRHQLATTTRNQRP